MIIFQNFTDPLAGKILWRNIQTLFNHLAADLPVAFEVMLGHGVENLEKVAVGEVEGVGEEVLDLKVEILVVENGLFALSVVLGAEVLVDLEVGVEEVLDPQLLLVEEVVEFGLDGKGLIGVEGLVGGEGAGLEGPVQQGVDGETEGGPLAEQDVDDEAVPDDLFQL